MGTGNPNQMILTPVSGVARARMFGAAFHVDFGLGHSRSRPAEPEGTFIPPIVKPVAPSEKPVESAPTAPPLEPARVPVPGAIPG
jgi:hypothetical protein